MLVPLLSRVVLDVDRQTQTAVDLSSLEGTDSTGFSGYTVVTKIRRAENIVGGNYIRLVLRAPNNTTSTLTAVYIGEVAASGNAYDFASTGTAVTFGGSASLSMAAKGVYVSDLITFDFNPAKAHLVAMNVSATALRRYTAPAGTRGVVSFYKAALSEAGTTVKTAGYTAQADTAYAIETIRSSRTLDEIRNTMYES